MRLARTLLRWIIALLLAFALVQLTVHPFNAPVPGGVKFYDFPGEHLVFTTLAQKSGVAAFEPAGRVVAGVLELFAAAALIVPPARRFGAWLLVVLMGCGTLLHLSPWLGQSIPVSTDILAPGSDGGEAFFLTVALLVGAALVLILQERPERPGARKL
jgi:uncharacterized membrane protein YphA (DoxX/SURF4 family)